jgi:hypothetical protein
MSDPDEIPSWRDNRRAFLKAGGAALGAAALAGLPGTAAAKPKLGGILRFATCSEARGIDPHRNLMYNVSQPLAATTQVLLDIAPNMGPAPCIATE